MKIHSAFNSLQQGILICNKRGQIIYYNEVYEKYLGVPLEEARGKKITSYRETSVVMKVIKSGLPAEGMSKKERGQTYYASVYPIFEEDMITGSISIVTSIEQHHNHPAETLTLSERVRNFEREEIRLCCERHGMDTAGKKAAAKELGISLATLYNKLHN